MANEILPPERIDEIRRIFKGELRNGKNLIGRKLIGHIDAITQQQRDLRKHHKEAEARIAAAERVIYDWQDAHARSLDTHETRSLEKAEQALRDYGP